MSESYKNDFPELVDNITYFQHALQYLTNKYGGASLPKVNIDKIPDLQTRDDEAIYTFFQDFDMQSTSIATSLPPTPETTHILDLYSMSGNL